MASCMGVDGGKILDRPMPVRGLDLEFHEVVFGGSALDRADLEGAAVVEGGVAGEDARKAAGLGLGHGVFLSFSSASASPLVVRL